MQFKKKKAHFLKQKTNKKLASERHFKRANLNGRLCCEATVHVCTDQFQIGMTVHSLVGQKLVRGVELRRGKKSLPHCRHVNGTNSGSLRQVRTT